MTTQLPLDLNDLHLPATLRSVDPETGSLGDYLGVNDAFRLLFDVADKPIGPGALVGVSPAEIEAADTEVVTTAQSTKLTMSHHQTVLELTKQPIVRDGRVVAILTVNTDITDTTNVNSERDLLATAAHITGDRLLLYRSLPGAVEPFTLVFANGHGEEFLRELEAVTDPLGRRAVEQLTESLAMVAETGEGHRFRLTLHDEFCLVRDEPLAAADGEVTGVARTISDITGTVEADWTEQLLDMATLNDTDEAIAHALDIGCELLGLPIGIVLELTDDAVVVRGRRNADALPDRFAVHSDFQDTMARTTITLGRDLQLSNARGPLVATLGLRSLAAVPIDVDGERWGLLGLADTEPRDQRFPQRAMPLLSGLGGALSHMLERDAARARLVPIELLQRSNRELEEYAYAAAHDLRSPLRSMTSFAQLLKQEVASGGDGERLFRYADRIIAGADQMDTLLRSMLDHARSTAVDDDAATAGAEVDLGEVVAEIRSELITSLEAVAGEVVVGELPTLRIDRTQIKRILHNLIDNAIKYRHEDRPPRISVRGVVFGGTDADGNDDGDRVVELRVSDNGRGIDPQHRERVFGLFKRLTGDDDGTGVGLAMVRRIVEEHGGSVTIESGSDPTAGTTFVVTLPGKLVVEPVC